jgi:hypothetical protein
MIVNTKFMPATNTKGSRVKAFREDGVYPPVTVDYDHSVSPFANHCEAMRAYVRKHDLRAPDGMMAHGIKGGYTFLACAEKVVV